ncbi:MAG TPA: NAD-dependent epimerase/dehydratase family protein [Longimicrobiaceae bacterium]|nr:NAD-dependent epimerase/dehydratase family protein [Longimicrobiaceae bacterium]
MRVFVTGATGFIGSEIVRELREAGHEVLGLARSEASAERLESAGVAVHRGDLTDTGSLTAGVAAYVGDGANRWSAVHRLDAARVFRLALENGGPGARWHAVAEEGVPMRAITETVGQGLGLPVRSPGAEEARAHFGDFLGPFVAFDNPASSTLTREALGWSPREIGLLADMRENGYFS